MQAGIDIVDIARFQKVAERTPGLLRRVFTEGELQYCQVRSNPYPSLAARFAAKEAVRKLDKGFIRGVKLQDIEVANDSDGKPYLCLHGRARDFFAGSGWSIALSLSHAKEQAIAMAVATKEGEL